MIKQNKKYKGGPEIWNVVTDDTIECLSIDSVLKKVKEALQKGDRTISIERQGAPDF